MNFRRPDLGRTLRLVRRRVQYSRLVLGSQQTAVIQAELAHVYHGVNQFLRELGVDYWLAYGTLLGYHRQGGIIPGDTDVDFGAALAAYPVIWAARTRLPAGFQMYDTSGRHRGPKLYAAWRGWEADIYFYEDLGGQLLAYESNSPTGGDHAPFPAVQLFPLRPAVFLGAPTFIPNDPAAHLTHMYGCLDADAVRDPRTGYWTRRPR